jgi:hypothetical protein
LDVKPKVYVALGLCLTFLTGCSEQQIKSKLIVLNGGDSILYASADGDQLTVPPGGSASMSLGGGKKLPAEIVARTSDGKKTKEVGKIQLPLERIQNGTTVVYNINKKANYCIAEYADLYVQNKAPWEGPSTAVRGDTVESMQFEFPKKELEIVPSDVIPPGEDLPSRIEKGEKVWRVELLPADLELPKVREFVFDRFLNQRTKR